MTRGLIYVVFGKDYEEFAAHAIAISRKFTDLPICVLTNVLAADRSEKWKGVDNVTFREFNINRTLNRDIKTSMIKHSPFDETIYIDCDAVIQNKGIEKTFDLLEGNDIVLNRYLHWPKSEHKILNIYDRAMTMFDVTLPLTIYNGALIAFRKNDTTKFFFERWNYFWNKFGRGREMPCLACTVKSMEDLKVNTFPKGFFAVDGMFDDAVIQHKFNERFYEKFDVPVLHGSYPFDSNPKDFSWKIINPL